MIYFDAEQHKALKHLAVDRATSMTELIRQAVDEFLQENSQRAKGPRK
jgi:hypothetical protein